MDKKTKRLNIPNKQTNCSRNFMKFAESGVVYIKREVERNEVSKQEETGKKNKIRPFDS